MRQLVDRIVVFIAAAVTVCACIAATGHAYEVSASDRDFLSAIVAAVEGKDSRWIASHALLPMVVNTGTDRKLVRTEAEMADAVASLLTDERRSAIKTAAQRPLFKNWRGVMAGDGVLWFVEFRPRAGSSRYLITAFGDFAFQPEEQPTREEVATGPAFKVHGRLSVYNGNPGCRIWIVGTKRILGVEPPEVSFMPGQLRQILTADNLIFADFTVVPLATDEPGVMRMVRVTAAENIVVTDGQLKFLRRVPEKIEE